MKSPLIIDPEDEKWLLLKTIIRNLEVRRIGQEISKAGLNPVALSRIYFTIFFIAMFFSQDITYVISEINKRPELRRFLNIRSVPSAENLYRFSSQFSEEQFVAVTKGILNTLSSKKKTKNPRTVIVDGTALSIDLNWFKKKYSKSKLESLPHSWGFSPSKGYYVGYKLTLAVEEKNLLPLAFLIHSGSPNDSAICSEIINELLRRHVVKEGDSVIFDRGYYSYGNYADPLRNHRILALILPKKNFNKKKLQNMLNCPISWFNSVRGAEHQKKVQELVRKLWQFLSCPDSWIQIRSKIEDVFKLGKNALSLERLHCYTRKSVAKTVALNVLLLGLLLLADSGLKNSIKQAAEW